MPQRPITNRPAQPSGLPAITVIAISLSFGWLIAVGLFFWLLPAATQPGAGFDGLRLFGVILTILMPIGMIWIAAVAVRSAKVMREETERLQASIDVMRQAYMADRTVQPVVQATVEERINGIAELAKKTETALATFTSSRDQHAPEPAPTPDTQIEEQPTLAFDTPIEDTQPPLSRADLIRALHFPDTDQDAEGFVILRRAMKDRNARQLIQASQDVLTLLSQEGIYMDDLRPDRVHPDVWRRFAKGERGRAMSDLGAVRDRSSLALVSGRMREDAIFRDAAHHFLRQFDQALVALAPDASDTEIAQLSETRSARAFMLLGRVTGAFD